MRYIDKLRASQRVLGEVFPVKSFTMSNDDMSDEAGIKDVVGMVFFDGIPQELQDKASSYLQELRDLMWQHDQEFLAKIHDLDVKYSVTRL